MSSPAGTLEATRETGPGPSGAGRWSYFFERDRVLGTLMLSPAILYLVLVVGYPLLLAFFYAVCVVTVGSNKFDFVGFQTFKAAISDPTFTTALAHSFEITVISQVLVVVLCTILAFVLAADFRGKWFLRFLVLLPWTTPVAICAINSLWKL